MERILEQQQQQPLCATLLELKKGDLMPTDREFSTREAFKEVMKPIVEITEANGQNNGSPFQQSDQSYTSFSKST